MHVVALVRHDVGEVGEGGGVERTGRQRNVVLRAAVVPPVLVSGVVVPRIERGARPGHRANGAAPAVVCHRLFERGPTLRSVRGVDSLKDVR